MIVIRKSHYVIMLAVLILVVAVAAMGNRAERKPAVGGEEPKSAESSASRESELSQLESAIDETADGDMVGVWIPYMSLTSDGTEGGFKENFTSKLDVARRIGATAVFVHVRPFADSMYPSEYEPWSHVLTGVQGEDPGYDPLEFMINAVHEAGMEFHAWVNPLRIASSSTPTELSENSFYIQNRDAYPYYFMEYDGMIYYNPACTVIRERIADSVAEIAEKYDVDGIHFDDYFYPAEDESLDSTMYTAYVNNSSEPLALHEWRTANINALIASVYRKIKQVNTDVVFGISPQGNLSNNEKINADIYTWCTQKGYIDYICPQLYYSFENPALPFETALNSWLSIPRRDDIDMYIGLAVYKAGTDADNGTWQSTSDTIARQIKLSIESGSRGVLLYAVDHLESDTAAAEMANAQVEINGFLKN